jgi:PEGA domain
MGIFQEAFVSHDEEPERSLGADGTLHGPKTTTPSTPLAMEAQLRGDDEAPLELVERKIKLTEYADPPSHRVSRDEQRLAGWKLAIPIVLVLSLLAVGAVSVWRPRYFSQVIPKTALVIVSEPPGATISIGSQVVGTTPWAGDNIWVGTQKVTLTHEGFRDASRSFQGQRDSTLNVPMEKR